MKWSNLRNIFTFIDFYVQIQQKCKFTSRINPRRITADLRVINEFNHSNWVDDRCPPSACRAPSVNDKTTGYASFGLYVKWTDPRILRSDTLLPSVGRLPVDSFLTETVSWRTALASRHSLTNRPMSMAKLRTKNTSQRVRMGWPSNLHSSEHWACFWKNSHVSFLKIDFNKNESNSQVHGQTFTCRRHSLCWCRSGNGQNQNGTSTWRSYDYSPTTTFFGRKHFLANLSHLGRLEVFLQESWSAEWNWHLTMLCWLKINQRVTQLPKWTMT